MNSDHSHLEALLEAALERRDAVERDVFLVDACAGDAARIETLRRLLEAHEKAGSFLKPPLAPGRDPRMSSTVEFAVREKVGSTIGRYKLIERLGEGGMGEVFLAEPLEPEPQRVAVKIIKHGMNTRQFVARFRAERRALALMDHPGIATVLDAGATPAGRPFFVMEYVHGVPLTTYCERRKLTLRSGLGLFLKICSAVQHAHRKGVVHRDLKPSNILVVEVDGRPQPKIIDFGLARAIGHESAEATLLTRAGQVLGTPGYMAPEQAAGAADVDPRADVYALGAILYELITGDASFERTVLERAGIEELLRLIREAEPARPSRRLASRARRRGAGAGRSRVRRISTLARRVRGDLDWIVMKALEKDRTRRYEDARTLAADVEHYLAHEPVVARPPTARYRVGKFVRRHHRALATAVLIVLSVLLGRL